MWIGAEFLLCCQSISDPRSGNLREYRHEDIRMCWVCGQRSVATNQPSASRLMSLICDLYLNCQSVTALVIRNQKVRASHTA